MPAQIYVKCPHCKITLPDTMETINIGVPFRDCSNCKMTFIDTHVMEWENASLIWKIKLFLGSLYGIAFYGIGFTIIPVLIISYLFDFYISNKFKLFIILIGTLTTAFLYMRQTPRQIKLSKQRTSNDQYREKLIRAGFKFRR